MNQVTVHFIDNSSKVFTTPGGVSIVQDQFWLTIKDSAGANMVGAVPREEVKYFTTDQDPAQ